MTQSAQEQFHSQLTHFSNAMLVTRASDGQLRSRPMAVAEVEENSNVWFVTDFDAAKVDEIQADPQVCVVMQDSSRFLSLSGHGKIIRDRNKVEELWSEAWKVWFPEGKDDPSIVLLKVESTVGEFWDNSGLKGIQYLFEAGKAYLSGERPDTSESMNRKVTL